MGDDQSERRLELNATPMGTEQLKAIAARKNCQCENLRYLRTYEDWFDGDEDDIYECIDCGKEIRKYVPR